MNVFLLFSTINTEARQLIVIGLDVHLTALLPLIYITRLIKPKAQKHKGRERRGKEEDKRTTTTREEEEEEKEEEEEEEEEEQEE